MISGYSVESLPWSTPPLRAQEVRFEEAWTVGSRGIHGFPFPQPHSFANQRTGRYADLWCELWRNAPQFTGLLAHSADRLQLAPPGTAWCV